MLERAEFVARLNKGERMSDLCREFGISRTVGYKIRDRVRLLGTEGLCDQSRAPKSHPFTTSPEVLELIYAVRREYPKWGAEKLREVLIRKHPGVQFPSKSVIHKWLQRADLIPKRKRKRKASPTPPSKLTHSKEPNDVWAADYKGQFRQGNKSYCYPLTITDHFSRYLIACEGMERINGREARLVFEEAFRKYGLPRVIRTDNGAPFASTGLQGLTTLSAWWLRLGIVHERIEPGHPEQNGRHERMHLTLKEETTRPAAFDLLRQQQKFDDFIERFNNERPHKALGNKCPAQFYESSQRLYSDNIPDLEYPLHDVVRKVCKQGTIHLWHRDQKSYISAALKGHTVGLRQIDIARWLVTFIETDIGIIDADTYKMHRL